MLILFLRDSRTHRLRQSSSGTQHPWLFPTPSILPHLLPYAAAPYRIAPDLTLFPPNSSAHVGPMQSSPPLPSSAPISAPVMGPVPHSLDTLLASTRGHSAAHLHLLYDKKKAFNPPLVARGFNLLWSNAATMRLDAMTAVSRLVTTRSTRWKRHPGIAAYLWMGRFGIGQLSVAHFVPLSEEDHDSWNMDGKVSLDSFAGVSPPQPPPRLDSIADIIKCVCTLHHHFLLYGYDLLIDFTRRAVEFLEGVETYLPGTLRLSPHIARILTWTDQFFNDLVLACHDDVMNTSYTHLYVASCFNLLHERHTKGPSLDYLRQELMLLGPKSLPGRPLPPAIPALVIQSSSTASSPPRNIIPRHLFCYLPNVDGKQVCMKFMTMQGRLLPKCPRKHVIVRDLNDKVKEFLNSGTYGGGPCAEMKE